MRIIHCKLLKKNLLCGSKLYNMKSIIPLLLVFVSFSCTTGHQNKSKLIVNDKDYFESPGLNVMVFEDIYPEGHQGGVGIIQHGVRVATNGDIRLEPTPGQWQPIPKVGKRTIDREANLISVKLWYPDSNLHRKGFNPIIYPDLRFTYTVNVKGEGDSFIITVDLDEPLPPEWYGKVGFNLELYPATLFGKSWIMDNGSGIFTRQANGPVMLNPENENQAVPMATGRKLVIAPESDEQRITIESSTADMQLIDGRIRHTNGWFVIRSVIPAGGVKEAIKWTVKANVIPGWKSKPVVHVSQVGYHPLQPKIAIIEQDGSEKKVGKARLIRINNTGSKEIITSSKPTGWGMFLRYNYLRFDFSEVSQEGVYMVQYDDVQSTSLQFPRNL